MQYVYGKTRFFLDDSMRDNLTIIVIPKYDVFLTMHEVNAREQF
jgi:hypothetical protein